MPDKIDMNNDLDDTEYHFTDDLSDHSNEESTAEISPSSSSGSFKLQSIFKTYKHTLIVILVFSIIFVVIFFSLSDPNPQAQEMVDIQPVTVNTTPKIHLVEPHPVARKVTAPIVQPVTHPENKINVNPNTNQTVNPTKLPEVVSVSPSMTPIKPTPVVNPAVPVNTLNNPSPVSPVVTPPLSSSSPSQPLKAPEPDVNKSVIIVTDNQESPALHDNYSSFSARLEAVEEANKNMVSSLHEQIDQRFAELVTENKVLATQIINLMKNIRMIQDQTNQLSVSLSNKQDIAPVEGIPNNNELEQEIKVNDFTELAATKIKDNVLPPSTKHDDKPEYIVQAIIPGRAWLRGNNNETITVAVGEILPNLGRVVKIDPYNGNVQINNGKKIITLVYGNS